jgi:hypothetical protein
MSVSPNVTFYLMKLSNSGSINMFSTSHYEILIDLGSSSIMPISFCECCSSESPPPLLAGTGPAVKGPLGGLAPPPSFPWEDVGLQPGRGKIMVWERVGGLGDSQTFDTERCNSDRWTRLGLFSSDLTILASKSWELTDVRVAVVHRRRRPWEFFPPQTFRAQPIIGNYGSSRFVEAHRAFWQTRAAGVPREQSPGSRYPF